MFVQMVFLKLSLKTNVVSGIEPFKPFDNRELMARVRSVLRRSGSRSAGTASEVVRIGALVIDPLRHEVHWHGCELQLTALEFELLHTLGCHPEQVLSREQLLTQIWGYDYYGDLRVVDAAIKRLRAKLRQAIPGDQLITTVRGVGYKLTT